jgi:microcystin-dependent protein
MSVEKLLAVEGYLGYPSDTHPTTDQEMQAYMENQNHVLGSIVDGAKLWQPETEYALGAVIRSSGMPENTSAKVTVPGISGIAEPTWTAIGTSITDGTCTCLMVPQTTESATVADIRTGTSEILAITPAALKAYMTDIYAQANLDAHPVGCIYESTKSTSPADLFGGTWETLAAGCVLVGAGTGDSGTAYTAGATGGEETHTLSTGEMPSHGHYGSTSTDGNHAHSVSTLVSGSQFVGGHSNNSCTWGTATTSYSGSHSHIVSISSTGGGQSHNNMQPYKVVYRWQRTA